MINLIACVLKYSRLLDARIVSIKFPTFSSFSLSNIQPTCRAFILTDYLKYLPDYFSLISPIYVS